MVIGLSLNFIGINPIHFLVFAAVFNGVAAVPLIWIINRIAADRRAMGTARSGWLSRTNLTLTFLGMAGSVAAMAISYLKGLTVLQGLPHPSQPRPRRARGLSPPQELSGRPRRVPLSG